MKRAVFITLVLLSICTIPTATAQSKSRILNFAGNRGGDAVILALSNGQLEIIVYNGYGRIEQRQRTPSAIDESATVEIVTDICGSNVYAVWHDGEGHYNYHRFELSDGIMFDCDQGVYKVWMPLIENE